MVRKCSHCGEHGHNSRVCISTRGLVSGGDGVRLFGVQLHMDNPLKKSFAMECLSHNTNPASSTSPYSSSSSSFASVDETTEKMPNGRTQERKKGVPWTAEEHRAFLAGLKRLGKGDWRGISRNFVTTRTPTQVASHAQKYFLRQNKLSNTNCRSSRFDVVSDCKRAAQTRPSSTSEDRCFSSDLNSLGQEQETHLHPYLSLKEQSYRSLEGTKAQLSYLDLELRISTSTVLSD